MSHSREPWIWLSTGESWEVACCMEDDPRQIALLPDENEADAHRICAAVNACTGLSTESLESGVVTELVTVLQMIHDAIECESDWTGDWIMREISAVLTKTRGVQP